MAAMCDMHACSQGRKGHLHVAAETGKITGSMKQLMRIHIERRNVRLPQESSFKRSGNFFPSLQATAIRTSRMILIFFALHKRLANRGIPSSAFPQACAIIFQAFGIGSRKEKRLAIFVKISDSALLAGRKTRTYVFGINIGSHSWRGHA